MDTKKVARGRAQAIPQEGVWRAEKKRVGGTDPKWFRDAQPSGSGPTGEDKMLPQVGESDIPVRMGFGGQDFMLCLSEMEN